MHWIIELLMALLSGFARSQENDRSVVGKSRLDEETERFWKWCAAAACVVGIIVWVIFQI